MTEIAGFFVIVAGVGTVVLFLNAALSFAQDRKWELSVVRLAAALIGLWGTLLAFRMVAA